MSFNLTAGNPRAHRVRLYYTESSTIYEGMPVCYEFDATTNWFGGSVSKGAVTATTTTAEGSQNEGKYIRVEDPDADNIHAFAGVVAKGGWCGTTGPKSIDVYVPNGAIVPVRTDQNCTVGRTILAVHTAEQHLTCPLESAARPVAVAWETVDCATTTGLTLARLDPNIFINQKGDASALLVDDEDTGTTFVNQIKIESAQTSANFCAFSVQSTCSAGAGSDGYGASLYVQGDLTGVAATHWNPFGCWANITGGTQTGCHFTVAEFGIYASGANLAACSSLSCITLRNQVSSTNPPNAVHNVIRVVQDGAGDSADFLFSFYTPDTVGMAAESSAAVSHVIPIKLENTGGGPAAGTYYIMISDAA